MNGLTYYIASLRDFTEEGVLLLPIFSPWRGWHVSRRDNILIERQIRLDESPVWDDIVFLSEKHAV